MKLSGQTPVDSVEAPREPEPRTLFTFVVQKAGEQWLYVSAQNTDIVPHRETHVRNEKGELIPINYRQEKS
jgi:hypothetical protein